MILMPPSVVPATYAVAIPRVSCRPQTRKWLIVLCTVLAVLLGGAVSIASAQTAHFSGAQTTLVGPTVGGGFVQPDGVALDRRGNLYVADSDTNTIYEMLAVDGTIPTAPTIRILAENLGNPESVAVDSSGNVYFTNIDTSANIGNNTVKEILAVNGSIPTSPTIISLGSGLFYPGGVAVDGNGNVFVADTDHHVVKEFLAVSGIVPASPTINTFGSGFLEPWAVAVDNSGNVYVADAWDFGIKELLAVNGSIPASPTLQVLGSSVAYPTSVAVDKSGNVYAANSGVDEVYEIVAVYGSIPTSPTVKSLANGIKYPNGLAIDGSGNLYVLGSTTTNNYVYKVSPSGNFGMVNLGATSATISMTFTFDTAGTLGSTAVLTQGATGLDFADAGTGTCKANTAYAAGQTCTVNVTFTPKFVGTRYGAVALYDNSENVIATGYLQGTGIGPQINFLPAYVPTGNEGELGGGFSNPNGAAVDGSGNVYVADYGNNAVKKIPPGCTSASCATTLGGGFNGPLYPAVDGSGNVYVTDSDNNAVKMIPPGCVSASCVATLGDGFNIPDGLAVDGSGNVYVTDRINNAVKEIPPGCASASCVTTLGGGFLYPEGVAVDGSGNVYVLDSSNSPVKEIPLGCVSASCVTTLDGLFSSPAGVAVDGSGNVYIADFFGAAVQEKSANCSSASCVTTLFGGSYPEGVAVDGSGNVYVTDNGNNAVMKIDRVTAPSLSFPSTHVNATSAAQTVTITNDGNAPLNFTNITYPALFPESTSATNDCETTTSLASNETCTLTIDFAPTAVGILSGSLVLTDNNLNAAGQGYATQSIALSGTGTQATPTIAWATPAPITFGTPLSAAQLNAGSTVAGTFTYSPAAGTVLTAGQQKLTATFTPTDTTGYTTASATVTLTVNQATPAITWAASAPITYGTPLSGAQLNATSTVAGSFTYSPAAGTVLTAGQQTLTATFTPTDTTGYTTASATVTLTVNQATPAITWAAPAAITYGTPLSATQLSATSTVAGTFTYSPAAGIVLTAGQQTLTATFTPTDTTDYTAASATVTLTVNQATPAITWAVPAAITYGTPLSAAQLNASSTVAGSFTYSPAIGTVLGAGQQTLTVTFAPTDSINYTTAMASVTLTVNKATPAIIWAIPGPITYGTPLGGTQLNASSTVAGSFTYSPAAGTVLTAGQQTLTATFAPTDTSDYASASASVTQTVNKATPAISWATPAAITYGTPLSATQLNASSTVAGSFIYSPAVGTVLNAGTQTLTGTFTPTDTTDYLTATATVTLTVNKAALTISWATPAAISYGTALSATQLDATSTAAGTFAYSPAEGTVLAAGSQTLAVIFTPTDTTDYSTASTSVTLTVNKATPTITWATPAPINYGTALSATQLDASSAVAGSFAVGSFVRTVFSDS